MSVVDLPLVMVNNTISFILHVRLVVPGLGQDHNLQVLCPITSPFVHVFLRVRRPALTNHDATRVTSIGEVDFVFF